MEKISDNDFDVLVKFVRERYGINLEKKRTLVDARLNFDVSRRGFKNFSTYIETVIENPAGEECQHMINRLSTNHTYFFREMYSFDHLRGTVLPQLVQKNKRCINIWSAACSTGEEVYSIAMMLEQLRNSYGNIWDYRIVGTDINTDVLSTAKQGIYLMDENNGIPKEYQHFITLIDKSRFMIKPQIIKKIEFQRGNIIHDSVRENNFDVVFCRNVMIYFDQETRLMLVKRLYSSMKDDGYLYIGTAETANQYNDMFRYIGPSIYQKGTRNR